MSGFVANSPAVAEDDITNIDFYPSISLVDCRAAIRLDQTVTTERLQHALINAMQAVNADLSGWKAEQESAGYTSLAAVPADTIGGISSKINLYHRAVYSHAKAELAERYRDYDSTLTGAQRADDMNDSIDDYRRASIIAIRALMDRPRSTVELI